MERMTKSEVLRKCIVIFEALKRVASKGNAGLEAARGAEDEYRMDSECCEVLREMLREMQAEGQKPEVVVQYEAMKDWQMKIMEEGRPPERLVL